MPLAIDTTLITEDVVEAFEALLPPPGREWTAAFRFRVLRFFDDHPDLDHLLATALYLDEVSESRELHAELVEKMQQAGLTARHVRALAAMERQAEKSNIRASKRMDPTSGALRPSRLAVRRPRPRARGLRRRTTGRRARSPGRLDDDPEPAPAGRRRFGTAGGDRARPLGRGWCLRLVRRVGATCGGGRLGAGRGGGVACWVGGADKRAGA